MPLADAELPSFAARYHVTTVVVDPSGRDPGEVVALFSDVYGAPVHAGTLDIWPLRNPSPTQQQSSASQSRGGGGPDSG
jgi:hypothetical protein